MEKKIAGGCLSCASPGAAVEAEKKENRDERVLSQWPIQIKLMGTAVPFLEGADLLVAADCTAFAAKGFHEKFLGRRKLLIGCPKLDGAQSYIDKFAEMFANNNVRSVSCLRMEVPCCGGMTVVLKEAIKRSGKEAPLTETIVGVRGDVVGERAA